MEVCLGTHWGTVCDDGFHGREATVVCRQLGFSEDSEDIIIAPLSPPLSPLSPFSPSLEGVYIFKTI